MEKYSMTVCYTIMKIPRSKNKFRTPSRTEKADLKKGFRMFSLIWPAAMKNYRNKRKCLVYIHEMK